MLQRIKTFIMTMTGAAVLLVPAVAAPATVFAASASNGNGIIGGICTGVESPTGSSDINLGDSSTIQSAQCDDSSGNGSSLTSILKLVVNILSIVVGFVAVIMIIVAGFRYITSGGESGKVTGAKNAIVYAIIGLIIVALAQVIVRFVISRASNIN